MKFSDFQEVFSKKYPFSTRKISFVDKNFSLKQLYIREQKWRILHLMRWWWCYPQIQKFEWFEAIINNLIYEPSYLSMEWALRFYNLIPEWVFMTTSCTTKKTQTINTQLCSLKYYSISKKLFFWYNLFTIWAYKSIRIATPEKAICDYLYFHPEIKDDTDFEWLRFNTEIRKEIYNKQNLIKYAKIYPQRVQNTIQTFLDFVKE